MDTLHQVTRHTSSAKYREVCRHTQEDSQKEASGRPEEQQLYPGGPEEQQLYSGGPEEQQLYSGGPEERQLYPGGPEEQQLYPGVPVVHVLHSLGQRPPELNYLHLNHVGVFTGLLGVGVLSGCNG